MSSFFPSRSIFIGIDATSTSNRIAILRKNRKGWGVTYLKQTPRDGHVNPLYNLPKEGISVSALPSRDVLVRSCEIQLKKEKDVKAALEYQVEPLLPYPADQAIVQAQIAEKRERGTALTAFAVRKDHLRAHLQDLNFEPECVTAVPYALASFSSLLPQTMAVTLLIHEGESEVTCALTENGKLLASRSFDREADLVNEVEKTVLSFSSIYKHKSFETIYFLSSDGSTRDQLQKATGKNVLFPSSTSLHLSHEELVRFGLAIGIAISAEGIDFRQKEFIFPKPWKRIKTPLIASFVFSLLLLAGMIGFGHMSLTQKKNSVRSSYLSLVGKSEKVPESPIEYLQELDIIEKEVIARPNTYPLLPQVPQVKEVLGWLNSYPQLTIETFHYSMQKRPDLSHKKERYKTKVELEFTAKSQTAARSFHEALLSKTSLIDPKEEVSWSTGKGKYRVSFYLKDKTRYN